MELESPELQADSLQAELPGKPIISSTVFKSQTLWHSVEIYMTLSLFILLIKRQGQFKVVIFKQFKLSLNAW